MSVLTNSEIRYFEKLLTFKDDGKVRVLDFSDDKLRAFIFRITNINILN